MANITEYGFRWVGSLSGQTSGPPVLVCRVASTYQATVGGSNVHLRPGDVVKRVNTGGVNLAAGGDTDILGVIMGIGPYLDSAGKKTFGRHLPGGTTWTSQADASTVLVIPAAGQIFEADCYDTAGTYDTQAEYEAFVGENADHRNDRDATNLWATPTLDIGTHVTTAAGWRILKISGPWSTDFASSHVKAWVTINESGLALAGSTSGI